MEQVQVLKDLYHFDRTVKMHNFHFAGIAVHYAIVQISTWIMVFAVFFYWGVQSPLSYRRHKVSRWFLYAHIASIVLGLILPLPAGFLPLRYGYIIDDVPVIACSGTNTDATYYTFTLPITILVL